MARDPDFARFWAAESISAVGSQFTAVALPLLAVLMLGASPMAVGVLTLIRQDFVALTTG